MEHALVSCQCTVAAGRLDDGIGHPTHRTSERAA